MISTMIESMMLLKSKERVAEAARLTNARRWAYRIAARNRFTEQLQSDVFHSM